MNSELKVVLEPGVAQKLQFAINRNDGSLEDVEYLSTGGNFRAVSLLRTGKAKLVEVTETGSEGAVIPTVPTPTAWTVDDAGNIHFTLTSNGFNPEQWEQRLGRRDRGIGDLARQVLRLASEAPTNGVIYNIVVRPGRLISDSDRITRKICAAADEKGWFKTHWEVACLILDTFTYKELEHMCLWSIVTMHEPIKGSGYDSYLLDSYRDSGRCYLRADNSRPEGQFGSSVGFAFEESKIGS